MSPNHELNIFQDVVFKSLKNVCDALFKKGIGTETKVTPVITVNEEDALWLDLDTPKGIL